MNFGRRIFIALVVIIFNFSSLGQHINFGLIGKVSAAGEETKTDLVAIFVDNAIYGSIQGDLTRYTTQYIPKQAPGTKTLIFPIDTAGFAAADIQHILENLYFDGEQGVPSQLVGVILFGEIPLPVVELDGKRFGSIYPYVDFIDPMFIYDQASDLFIYNSHPESQPEAWHSMIPLNEVEVFTKFFEKLKQYDADPELYADPKIWYDDFVYLKQSYTEEELDRYINTLLFAEAESYRTDNSLFQNILSQEEQDDLIAKVSETKAAVDGSAAESLSDPELGDDPEALEAAATLVASSQAIMNEMDTEKLKEGLIASADMPIPTLPLERTMLQNFTANHTIFGNSYLTDLQENLLAGGRYQLDDIDTSLEKIEIKDRVIKQYLQDMNKVMEAAVDRMIDEEQYDLKYPLPYLYIKHIPWEGDSCATLEESEYDNAYLMDVYKDIPLEDGQIIQHGPFKGAMYVNADVGFDLTNMVKPFGNKTEQLERYENHYFGKNAVDIDSYKELTIYRGEYVNQTDLGSVYSTSTDAYKTKIDDIPDLKIEEISVGASLGYLSQQVAQNRAFNFDLIFDDKEIYDQYKCEDEQPVDEFSRNFRGGASIMNIEPESFGVDPKHPITKPDLTRIPWVEFSSFLKYIPGSTPEMINLAYSAGMIHEIFMGARAPWNPSIEKEIGGPRQDVAGGIQVPKQINRQSIHEYAQTDYAAMVQLRGADDTLAARLFRSLKENKGHLNGIRDYVINRCKPRQVLNDDPTLNNFDEVEFFHVFEDKQELEGDEYLRILVNPGFVMDEDIDNDGIPNDQDEDMDGDGELNGEDEDMDGDRVDNVDDSDMDGDGVPNGEDMDTDGDGKPNRADDDNDGDGEGNSTDPDVDGDGQINAEDSDVDGDGVPNDQDGDVDGDGVDNGSDGDIDGDGELNGEDSDADGDGQENGNDGDCNGNGTCNGNDNDADGDGESNENDNDVDGDGEENADDNDIDGDGIPNEDDNDIDGDGTVNQEDPDMDGDGVLNENDGDTDGDRILNEDDDTPDGPVFTPAPPFGGFDPLGGLFSGDNNCTGLVVDIDDDGLANEDDQDVDGDGLANFEDSDIDGDGLENDEDSDIDCDGDDNGEDEDVDCDGVANGQDGDCDGDGTPNGEDGDCDGDGQENGVDPDVDGDGQTNGEDPDVDGDAIENGSDADVDNDGLTNANDTDIDGDGIPNGDEEGGDTDGDGRPNDQDTDIDGDGLTNNEDGDMDGDGVPNGEDPDMDNDGIPYDQTQGANEGLAAQKVERGSQCFDLGHDYRYKIIDTVVEHKDPDEKDIDEMTALTLERPIDDGRYVTFHGIGGDVVKFIYPDLYNVPVYECQILTQEAIKAKLIEYLQQKVQLYNQYLGTQLDNSSAQYGEHPEAYDFLQTVHPAATPNRAYGLFPENFFVDLLGDENLDRIAEGLYYMNSPWDKKPPTGTIGEYIEQSREHFELDTKIELTHDDYLQYDDPADEFKFDDIAYPTHIDPERAYEMGYINSDGLDIIQQSKAETPTIEDVPDTEAPEDIELDTRHLGGGNQVTAGQEDDAECGVSAGQAVSLMKWPKAFTCWLQNTLEKPFEFEIEIDVTRDDSYQDRLRERQDEASRDFGRLSVGVPGDAVKFDSDGYSEQVIRGLSSSVYAATTSANPAFTTYITSDERAKQVNAQRRSTLSAEDQELFDTLKNNMTVAVEGSTYFQIGESTTTQNLVIKSEKQKGTMQVNISQYGNNCAIVSTTNLCNQDLNLTFDAYSTPTSLPIKLQNNEAGTNILQVTTCQNSVCAQHDVMLHIASAPLSRLAVTLPGDVVVKGGTFPIAVGGFDTYENAITYSTIPYVMHVSGGTFLGQPAGTTKTINHFPEAAYLIDTAGYSDSEVTISLIPQDPALPTLTHTIPLVPASLNIQSTHGGANGVIYRLPNKQEGFTTISDAGVIEVRDDILPHLNININAPTKNPQDSLLNPITIESLNGLVEVGTTTARQTDNGYSQKSFTATDTFLYEGDQISITLLPSGRAGKDEIIVTSPGMPTQHIPVTILPSGPDVMNISFIGGSSVRSGQVLQGQVMLADSRGNSYNEPAQVQLDTRGEFEIEGPSTIITSGGYAQFTGVVVGGGGGGCRGKTSQSQVMFEDENGPGQNENGNEGDDPSNGGNPPGNNPPSGPGGNLPPTQGNPTQQGGPQSNPDQPTGPNNPDDPSNPVDPTENPEGPTNEEEPGGEGEGEGDGTTPPAVCSYDEPIEDTNTDPDRYEDGYTFAEAEITTEKVLWPNDPVEDDLNVMYLNLFGKARGNSLDTARYLKNTKTLAITTQFHPDAFASAGTVATLVHPDGRVQDPLGIVSELRADGGDLVISLGRQEGIGRVILGSYTEFDFYSVNPPTTPSGERGLVIYTPGLLDSFVTSNKLDSYKVRVNDLLLIDFARGYMHPDAQMILGGVSGSYQTRQMLYQNKPIGTFAVWRKPLPLAPYIRVHNGGYEIENMPFGGSTNSDIALSIVQLPQDGFEGESSIFESIQTAINPRKDVGFRHQFMNMTNFAQGLPVGQATQHFGGPFVINFGDPFLKRTKENRTVKSTDYDDGIGKMIFSDSADILDVDTIDYNHDDKPDMIIAYKDGSIRILQNHGGAQPFMDLGMLIVVADGIKEMFGGDVDGDGREDIMVRTTSDKLRVYRNDKGIYEVDGQIVCLDIPNGDKNVAQVRQLFGEDMDGDGNLDIITNDVNGDIKVFYGGGGNGGANYLSTDPFVCDDERKSRQNMQLVKSFGTTLGGPIADESLRHRPGLRAVDPDEDVAFDEGLLNETLEGVNNQPDFEKMTKKQMKQYAKDQKKKGSAVPLSINPQALLDEASKTIDLVIAAPDDLKPIAERGLDPLYGVVRAIDPTEMTPRFDVSKQFVDVDGGKLLKGDLVDIHVSLNPVGAVGPVTYWEKLDGPWIVYKDEYNIIDPFEFGDLPEDADIDRNVGGGYEFRIANLPLAGSTTFTYTVQYNGDGYVNIDIETIKKEFFKGPSDGSFIGKLASPVYAQAGREKRIRAYPVDACYKQYRLFSPGESLIDLQDYLDEKTKEYEDYFNDQRDAAMNTIISDEDFDAKQIKDYIGAIPFLSNSEFESWKAIRLNEIFSTGIGETSIKIDTDKYLEFFVDEAVLKIKQLLKDDAEGLIDENSLGMFEDFEFGYQKCSGVKFGKDLCGQGLPIPFNIDFLSPGTFNVMGCKLMDFKGLPLFAFPTNGTIPIWPIFPSGAGGVFGGSTSQFRLYVSPTLTAGLGVTLCFAPFTVGMKIKSPPGDFVGNCLVIAGNLGPQCKSGDPVKETTLKEQESRYIVEEEQRDLGRLGTCEQRVHEAQPFKSDVLGDKVAIGGKPISIQATNEKEEFNADRIDINLAGNGPGVTTDVIALDRDYLKGGTSFDLQIEGGNVRGLAQCIVRKWVENQTRYFANNALHMHIDIMFPDISELGKNIDKLKDVSDLGAIQFDRDQYGKAFEKISAPGTTEPYQDDTEGNKKTIFPSKSLLTSINTTLNNPFETVAAYFENIPLVNFEDRTTSFEIPFFYQEDLVRYEVHLRSWIERNEIKVAEREKSPVITADALNLMKQALSNARRNLDRIEAYRELPLKINALLHTYDQYLIEVYRFVDNFINEIVSWLQYNASRFGQRVDFAILLIGIAETRQVLIDFSVDRHSKCAKCRQDNYDFYSCKLKMLCFDLPVLPIPNFHIPDIYLDLSEINIGIDIIIPHFQFVPRKFSFPRLPELPDPRDIEIEINIPDIPVLPLPPPLPDLPELDMDIDLELPTLPPPPKLPKIAPAVKTVVKIADFIGTLLCLVKGSIGLVAEQGVKTRVEQMTQRKQDVEPFDSLKITRPESPQAGYDYKIGGYLDVKVDFALLYDAVDSIAEEWNDAVDVPMNAARRDARDLIDSIADDIDDAIEDIGDDIGPLDPDLGPLEDNIELDGDGIDINFDGVGALPQLPVANNDASILAAMGVSLPEEMQSYLDAKNDRYVGGEVEDVRNVLLEGLDFLAQRADLPHLLPAIEDTQRVLTTDHAVQPNFKGLETVRERVKKDIDILREENGATMKLLTEGGYDTFVDSLSANTLISDNSQTKTYSSSLFNANQSLVDRLHDQPAPMETYLALNKPFVEGFRKSLQTHSAYELEMNTLEHADLLHYFDDISAKMSTAENIIDEHNRSLLAVVSPFDPDINQGGDPGGNTHGHGTGNTGGGSSTPAVSSLDIDFSQFIDGFLIPGKDGDYHDIIAWTEKANQFYKENTYDVLDINGDKEDDILLYDTNHIYVKYGKQQIDHPGGGGSSSYNVIGPFASMQALIDEVKDRQGRYEGAGGTYKLRDEEMVRYQFARNGQDHASMVFSWENDPRTAGRVVEVSDHVALNHEKNRPGRNDKSVRYLVVLPETLSEKGLDIEIEDQLAKDSIEDYLDDGKIVEVRHYDGATASVQSLLENIERKWYYTKVAPLRLEQTSAGGGFLGLFGSKDPDFVLKKVGPWSHQEVAGVQYRADDQKPTPTIEMIREITGEKVAEGTLLKGNINTKYRIEVKREDNAKVVENRVIRTGQEVKREDGEELKIEDLKFKQPREDYLIFGAIDQAGNVGQQAVLLQIGVPEIEIDEIIYQSLGADIIAELSSTIDEGLVKFQRERQGYWEPLEPDTYPVNPTDPKVKGGLFPFDTDITLFDEEGNPVATLNSDSGQLTFENCQGDSCGAGGNGNNQGSNNNGNNNGSSNNNGNSNGGGGGGGGQGGNTTSNNQGAGGSGQSGGNGTGGNSGNGGNNNNQGVSMFVDFIESGNPQLHIILGGSQQTSFTINMQSESLVGQQPIVLLDGTYQILPLDEGYFGDFAGGRCVGPLDDECHIFISEEGNVYLPEPFRYQYQADYIYNTQGEYASYIIHTTNGDNVLRIDFIPVPFQ